MIFYQAYVMGSGRSFELRSKQEDAVKDLTDRYDCKLTDERNCGVLFDKEKNMGVTYIHV